MGPSDETPLDRGHRMTPRESDQTPVPALSHDELVEAIRRGDMLDLATPGLREAARALIGPMVAGTRGRMIIYRCRGSFLMRVDELTMDDARFDASCSMLAQLPDSELGDDPRNVPRPFRFGSMWEGLRLSGKAIKTNMLPDAFVVDQKLVAELTEAISRKAEPEKLRRVLRAAWD